MHKTDVVMYLMLHIIIYPQLQSMIFKGGYVSLQKFGRDACNLIFLSITMKLLPIVKTLVNQFYGNILKGTLK